MLNKVCLDRQRLASGDNERVVAEELNQIMCPWRVSENSLISHLDIWLPDRNICISAV